MSKISRSAADKLRRTVQIVNGLAPKGAGFAPVGPQFLLAKTTKDHEEDETEDVEIYAGTKGSEVATGQRVKAYNRGAEVVEDEFVMIQWLGSGWEILQRGGVVRVIGPCVTYTPDMADPDTDFEVAYPGGCDGPDVLGLNIRNVGTGATTVERMELQGTSPVTLTTDTFSFSCKSGSVNVYAEVVFTSLDIEGVTCTIYRDSDDSVVQTYENTIYSWNPLAGGNLQFGPTNTSCDCGTLPFDLCLSVPTR